MAFEAETSKCISKCTLFNSFTSAGTPRILIADMNDAIKDKATRIDPKSWNGGTAEQRNSRMAEKDPKS